MSNAFPDPADPCVASSAEEKKELLKEKFQTLKKEGGLKTYIEKKRKRKTTKDQKAIPFSRRETSTAD